MIFECMYVFKYISFANTKVGFFKTHFDVKIIQFEYLSQDKLQKRYIEDKKIIQQDY